MMSPDVYRKADNSQDIRCLPLQDNLRIIPVQLGEILRSGSGGDVDRRQTTTDRRRTSYMYDYKR